MNILQAIEKVRDRYPFPEEFVLIEQGAQVVARTVSRYLEPGARILDFGSGGCSKTAVLQMLGYDCSAYDDLDDCWHREADNREKIVAFADEFGVNFHREWQGQGPLPPESCDLVMMLEVLEHLHDSPRELVNSLLRLVKPEGLLLATVPNAVNIRKRIAVLAGRTNLPPFDSYYWYPGRWRGHIREYTRHDLRRLCVLSGLEILELRAIHQMLRCVPRVARPLYRALTAIFKGWQDSWLVVARKPRDWSPQAQPSQNPWMQTS